MPDGTIGAGVRYPRRIPSALDRTVRSSSMRRLVRAWPVVPAMAAIALLTVPGGSDEVLRSALIALVAVLLTFAVTAAYMRSRVEPLVIAAEKLAGGETEVEIPTRRDDLGRRLGRAMLSVRASVAAARSQAATDILTGAPNRPALVAALFAEVERSVRHRRPLAVAFGDIDNFKSVNDTYGHEVGDEVLKGVVDAIRGSVRVTDIVGRYGGEEIVVILPETTVEDAAALADSLRLVVGRRRFAVASGEISVTVSFGVAGAVGDRLGVESLLRQADAAMYSAKALGRDQVYAFTEPDDDASVIRSPISPRGRAEAMDLGKAAHGAAAETLAAILSPLPHYRGQPSALIATIVAALARNLDLPRHEVDKVRVAALLHDVGKVGIPADILEKPAALTPAEWRSVVQHPRIGQVILEQATVLRDAVPIILHHHERFGGAGYPYGLRGQEIPLGARIVAIADAYDAMTQDRPYKRAISHQAAIDELRRHAGTQFDPELVELFCDLYGARPPEVEPGAAIFAADASAHRGGVQTGRVLPASQPGLVAEG